MSQVVTLVEIQQEIVKTAVGFLGQKELKNNSGFQSAQFQKLMESVGWNKGNAWCAFFAELVWCSAYTKLGYEEFSNVILRKIFSPSATGTYQNFIASKNVPISKVPEIGALAVWQLGNSWKGHIGIVESLDLVNNTFQCIEGNGNPAGSREGIEVVRKNRKLNLPFSKTQLNLLGFVYPIKPL